MRPNGIGIIRIDDKKTCTCIIDTPFMCNGVDKYDMDWIRYRHFKKSAAGRSLPFNTC